MTPEQVAKTRAVSYAMLGAGIAVFIVAYQYSVPVSYAMLGAPRHRHGILVSHNEHRDAGAEPVPAFVPYMFAAIGVVFFIVAGFMWRKTSKQNVAPARPVDLSGPQGKIVIGLMVIGFVALVGSYFSGYLIPHDEMLETALSVGLLLVMIVCFLIAARIARKIRRNMPTSGVGQ
jgi:hypothetical protein